MDHLFSYTSTIDEEEERAYEPTANQKCHWSIGRLVLL